MSVKICVQKHKLIDYGCDHIKNCFCAGGCWSHGNSLARKKGILYDQLVRSCLLIRKRYLVLPVVCMENIDLSANTCKQFANQLRTWEKCNINHREHVSSCFFVVLIPLGLSNRAQLFLWRLTFPISSLHSTSFSTAWQTTSYGNYRWWWQFSGNQCNHNELFGCSSLFGTDFT